MKRFAFLSHLSLSYITKSVLTTVKRFPLTMALAVFGTVLGLLLVEDAGDTFELVRWLWIAALLFPLSATVELVIQQHRCKLRLLLAGYALVALVLVALQLFIPTNEDAIWLSHVYRSFLMAGIFVLLFFSVPRFAAKKVTQDIWEYITQVITALVFSGAVGAILYAGTSIGLLSIRELFDIDFDERIFADMFVITVGIIVTTTFFSQLPDMTKKIEPKLVKALENIGKFVLAPLMVFYFCILYIYAAQRVIDGAWPDTLVSYMIIGFSLAAIATTAILNPLRATNLFVHWFRRALYVAIVPLVGVLFWAINFPIKNYGWTEKRYLVVVFGIWLLVIALYQLIHRKATIASIALSLAAVMLVTTVGPLSASSVSQHSQRARLVSMAEIAKVPVVNGVIQTTTEEERQLDENENVLEAEQEIFSILDYLIETHGAQSLAPVFEEGAIDSLYTEKTRYIAGTRVAKGLMGITPSAVGYPSLSSAKRAEYFHFSTPYNTDTDRVITAVPIQTYDYAVHVNYDKYPTSEEKTPITIRVNGEIYTIHVFNQEQRIEFRDQNDARVGMLSFADMIDTAIDTYESGQVPDNQMQVSVDDEKFQAIINFEFISGNANPTNGEVEISGFQAMVHFSLQ